MRTLALMSGGFFLLAAAQQSPLPAPLTRNYEALAAAPSLTVLYKAGIVGEAPGVYKLVLSRPGAFRLTTPTGFVVGDGTTVTTYKAATKTYTEEPYTDAWAASFARRPEVLAWGAYLLKEPATEVVAARAGTTRTILGNPTTEMEITLKKSTPATLYLDKKLGVARGLLMKTGEKETLVTASSVEIGKEPAAPDQFAFVAPEGSKKEEVMAVADYAAVQAIMTANCLPCHAADHARAGVVLSSYEGIVKAVTPGNPSTSLLVKAVHGAGAKKMPPGRTLSDAQMKTIEAWILDGAKN